MFFCNLGERAKADFPGPFRQVALLDSAMKAGAQVDQDSRSPEGGDTITHNDAIWPTAPYLESICFK